jgi:hypothetical protein
MAFSTMYFRRLIYCSIGLTLIAALGCEGSSETGMRTISASTIVLKLPERFGELERPPVEFDHARHVDALEREGCEACHIKNAKGGLVHSLYSEDTSGDRDAIKNVYHDKCLGCHKERKSAGRKTGPQVCADCHVIATEPVSTRKEMAFDYSLHERHVRMADKKCETCHHVYNEQNKALEYVKGKEDACLDCHGEQDQGKNLSLKNASHAMCIDCHLDRERKGIKRGPIVCSGCHEAENQNKYEKLPEADIPRLKRGQKDKIWLGTEGAKSRTVPFDHREHEKEARFCTSCHHKTPKPCGDCHTLLGKTEGGYITAEHAFHLASSKRSCVGCHQEKAMEKKCFGCHETSVNTPGQRACAICHSGESSTPAGNETLTQADAGVPVSAFPGKTELAALPAFSDDFPAEVVIKTLADEYQPSTMPHGNIVLSLDEAVRKSELASHFHGDKDVLCSGCHHDGEIDARPRPCRACHADVADPLKDKPGLRAAYHRQCIGCHQRIGITKALDCTDCHEKIAKEVPQ